MRRRHSGQPPFFTYHAPVAHQDDAPERETFLACERLIDCRRFEYLFLGGSKENVLSALRPYQNEDGGFGHALEPDLRTPLSQPMPAWTAFCILDELGALSDPMVPRALDYLTSITTEEGGVPFVLERAPHDPHAWWWTETDPHPPASLNPTAALVAFLEKHGVHHPWKARAEAFCKGTLQDAEVLRGYEIRVGLSFLEHVPDGAFCERVLPALKERLVAGRLVARNPDDPEGGHSPLFFAPATAHLVNLEQPEAFDRVL